MSGAWNPTRWLSSPWAGGFKPAPGVSMAPHLQLVRPVTGAPASNVWVVDQLTLQIEVAVKFAAAPVPAPRAPGAPAVEEPDRFLQQARCAARLADPHLLHVFEQGRWKGALFALTELLEGRSLRQLLMSGPFALPDVQAVLQQAAGVLAKAHPLGLVHGSVRPDHLFLIEAAGQPFLKIANFGDISAESVPPGAAADTQSAVFLRQQPYLTPEQIAHGRCHGAAADLWALGVTLYELLTTTLPFEAPTPAGVNAAICNGEFSPPSHYRADVPAAVDAWFARVLAKSPAARFPDAAELAREFDRALAGLTVAPPPPAQRAPEIELPLPSSQAEYEDERTVRWELPTDWGQPRSEAELASLLPPEPQRPSSGALSVPPPLPDRPSSYPPPPPLPGLAAVASPNYHNPAGRAGAAPWPPLRLQPLAPAYAPSPEPPRAPAPLAAGLTKTKGLLAGSLLGGVLTLSVWGYQSLGDAAEGPGPELSAETRTVAPLEAEEASRSVTGVASQRAASSRAARSNLANEDLPVVQTDELPRAPDEQGDEDGTGVLPESSVELGSRGLAAPDRSAGNRGPAGDEARSNSARLNARPEPARAASATKPAATVAARAVPPRAVPRRESPKKSTKPANSADCNPPYFFDSNNIRRLKLECL